MKQTLKTKFFSYLLVLLGFAATTSCEPSETPCVNGVPIGVYYMVSGKVVDKDSAPIAGIRVSSGNDPERFPTFPTDEDGSFYISWFGTNRGAYLYFQDIDGPENGGEFIDKTEEIKCEYFCHGSPGIMAVYVGMYGAKDVVIRMEKKK